jgi:hypothetical protein
MIPHDSTTQHCFSHDPCALITYIIPGTTFFTQSTTLSLSFETYSKILQRHGEKGKINGPYLSELNPSEAFEDAAVAQELRHISHQAGSKVDTTLAEVTMTLATGVVSTLAAIQDNQAVNQELDMTQAPPPAATQHHLNTVSAWQALWGIFVILLIFTPLAGCYIYLVKQGMRGDLDLNWESLENKPKNQLHLCSMSSTIDMPPSRKNSTCVEPHPGTNIESETISDSSSVSGIFQPALLRNDSCSLIDLEDL